MSTKPENVEELVKKEYAHGFVTEIEADTIAPGLNAEVITYISHKKNEPRWMLDFRLKAYQQWLKMATMQA